MFDRVFHCTFRRKTSSRPFHRDPVDADPSPRDLSVRALPAGTTEREHAKRGGNEKKMSFREIFVARPEPLLAPLLFLATDVLVAATVGRRGAAAARAAARASAAAASLRKEAKVLSSPATFAAAAKLERRAMALEREAERLSTAAAESGSSKSLIVKVSSAVKIAVFVALLVRWWGQPVAVLRPREAVWPLARWLAQPHSSKKNAAFGGGGRGGAGGRNADDTVLFGASSSQASFAGIAVLPWLAASRVASAAVARAFFGKGALA